MSTWTIISNAAVAVGGIPSSSTVTALRDNPAAIAQAANGAPVVFSGWHPVDKVSVGDGNTGLIYDHAVNGTVANVVTPDFEDGYEYRLYCSNLSHNNVTSSRNFIIEAFRATAADYITVYTSATTYGQNTNIQADVEFLMPRLSEIKGIVRATVGSLSSNDANQHNVYPKNNNKILRARIAWSVGSIDAGTVYLFRRREYISSP
jgi:hypothetical protein